jgi:hypothetical protein
MLSGTSRKISSLDNWKFYGLREEPSSTTNQYNEIEDLKDNIYLHLDSFKIILHLTRTVVLINLSRFLRGLLLSRKFIMYGAPGFAHLPASKLLHRDKFLAP